MLEITLGPYRCPFRPWAPHQDRVFDGLFCLRHRDHPPEFVRSN
jgi:hypothetical protein